MKRMFVAILAALALAASAQAAEVSMWMWASPRYYTDGSVEIKLDVWMQSDSTFGSGKVSVEYHSNRFTVDRLELSPNFFGGFNPDFPCEPNCSGMGAGTVDILTAIVANPWGYDVTEPTHVMSFYLDVPGGADSLHCIAEPFKFYCAPMCNGEYTTEFSTINGYTYSYGQGDIALANACYIGPWGAQYGCPTKPACPADDHGYSECPKCPPQLEPKPLAVQSETWTTVKHLYR